MVKILRIAVILAAVTAAACNQNKEDPRVAELQKELDAAKKELEAGKAGGLVAGGPGASAPFAAVPQAAAPSAGQQTRLDAAPQKPTPDQGSRDRAATEKALADQKATLTAQQDAAVAKQNEENQRLRREMEQMKPREFRLPAGTIIPVRTTAELSTAKVKDGSVFETVLEKDLVVDGTTLAKAGALVTCVVVSADPGGRVKGTASLSVAARSIAGTGNNPIPIKTESFTVDAESTKGRDAKRTGIATAIGAGIGAIAGGGSGAAIGAGAGAAAGVGATVATRGKPAVIATETLIEFALSAPATAVIRPAAGR
jgi:hypothetical protein